MPGIRKRRFQIKQRQKRREPRKFGIKIKSLIRQTMRIVIKMRKLGDEKQKVSDKEVEEIIRKAKQIISQSYELVFKINDCEIQLGRIEAAKLRHAALRPIGSIPRVIEYYTFYTNDSRFDEFFKEKKATYQKLKEKIPGKKS